MVEYRGEKNTEEDEMKGYLSLCDNQTAMVVIGEEHK